ncbi:MAG: phosphonoacetaldehyde dehydrogenase [Alphaproteobacteria bacterium]|nr:phosphonoacetaldehyde dehydrogenase [Alphaproteobacteria bacterium]
MDASNIGNDILHETLRLVGDDGVRDERLEVLNPYTNAIIGTVPKATIADVRRAFQTAADFQPSLSRFERSEILKKAGRILFDRKDEVSDLITAETGLSKKDSLYESTRCNSVFNLAAALTLMDDGEIYSCDVAPTGPKRKIFTNRQPLTAISAITPFNHPLNQVAHKIAPSIATNNCMVLKPTEKTPLTALLLADVLYEAGLPAEMFQVITGDPADIADEFITNEHVELVTFTGGVPIGKYIAEKAGYRRTVLELGGNDPLIVMEDADLERAATLAVAGATKNSGQRCTAVKRILVVDAVGDDFVKIVEEKVKDLKHGDPMDPDVDVGTVIDHTAAMLFERRVNNAIENGAELLYGNVRNGASYSPTLLDRVPYDCELVKQETFGPVVPIIRCPDDIDEVIKISNSTAYGLSSGVCTNRMDYITQFIDELKVGTVNVWEVPGFRIEMSPFGGIKDSGLGYKEGVVEAMKSFTNVKTFSMPWPS